MGQRQAVPGSIQHQALSGGRPHRSGAGQSWIVISPQLAMVYAPLLQENGIDASALSQELEEQYLAGELLADLSMKDSRAFRKEIDRICEEVF